jgi:hypothetical protein
MYYYSGEIVQGNLHCLFNRICGVFVVKQGKLHYPTSPKHAEVIKIHLSSYGSNDWLGIDQLLVLLSIRGLNLHLQLLVSILLCLGSIKIAVDLGLINGWGIVDTMMSVDVRPECALRVSGSPSPIASMPAVTGWFENSIGSFRDFRLWLYLKFASTGPRFRSRHPSILHHHRGVNPEPRSIGRTATGRLEQISSRGTIQRAALWGFIIRNGFKIPIGCFFFLGWIPRSNKGFIQSWSAKVIPSSFQTRVAEGITGRMFT